MTEAEAIEAAVNAALPIPGWMTEEELRHLATRARSCKTFLEVGSWQGRSAACIAKALPAGSVLYSVDNWVGEQATPMDAQELRSAFIRNLLPEFACGKVVSLSLSSSAFAHMVRVGWIDSIQQFDAIFLDGDHDYNAVCADIDDFWPLVRAQGLLLGHDYHLDGVLRALAHKLPNARPVAGSIWEIVRPT